MNIVLLVKIVVSNFQASLFCYGNFINACTFLYSVYGLLFILQCTGTVEICAQHILLNFKHYELNLKILRTLTYSGAEVICMKS